MEKFVNISPLAIAAFLGAVIPVPVSSVSANPIPAYTSTGASTGGAAGNLDIGRQFTVGAGGITVSFLGVYNDAATNPTGLADSHEVILFSLNQTGAGATATAIVGGSVTVPAGALAPEIGGFRYKKLDAPLSLAPGDYAVVAYGMSNSGDPYGDQPEPPATTGRLEGPVAFDAGFDPFEFPGMPVTSYPGGGDGNNHASASFLFYAPEPASLGIVGLIVAATLSGRRRSA